jgi:L-asparaginase
MTFRARLITAVICLLIAAPAWAAAATADEPPIVKLVATGGTISNRAGGRLTAEELVSSIPILRDYVRAEFEQFANTASSDLTLAQFLDLSRRLNTLFAERQDLAGIVVTCGTDTLEELAYFLHLTVRDDRPVVVVGSMRNPSTIGYEGAANLLGGFRVAASQESRGKGTLVVLNDEINSAREATKTDALRLQTFQSRPAGALGVVDSDRVVYYRSPVKRHTSRSEFDVTALTSLPRVDVVLVYQDASGDIIKALVALGVKGIVVAGAGAGATSGTQMGELVRAAEKGVIVVTTTRTGSGRVSGMRWFGLPPASLPATAAGAGGSATQGFMPGPTREAALAMARRVGGEDLAPVKARLLLMLALATTSDPVEIQRMFREY